MIAPKRNTCSCITFRVTINDKGWESIWGKNKGIRARKLRTQLENAVQETIRLMILFVNQNKGSWNGNFKYYKRLWNVSNCDSWGLWKRGRKILWKSEIKYIVRWLRYGGSKKVEWDNSVMTVFLNDFRSFWGSTQRNGSNSSQSNVEWAEEW